MCYHTCNTRLYTGRDVVRRPHLDLSAVLCTTYTYELLCVLHIVHIRTTTQYLPPCTTYSSYSTTQYLPPCTTMSYNSYGTTQYLPPCTTMSYNSYGTTQYLPPCTYYIQFIHTHIHMVRGIACGELNYYFLHFQVAVGYLICYCFGNLLCREAFIRFGLSFDHCSPDLYFQCELLLLFYPKIMF